MKKTSLSGNSLNTNQWKQRECGYRQWEGGELSRGCLCSFSSHTLVFRRTNTLDSWYWCVRGHYPHPPSPMTGSAARADREYVWGIHNLFIKVETEWHWKEQKDSSLSPSLSPSQTHWPSVAVTLTISSSMSSIKVSGFHCDISRQVGFGINSLSLLHFHALVLSSTQCVSSPAAPQPRTGSNQLQKLIIWGFTPKICA